MEQKKKSFKPMIAVLLAAALLVGILPASVRAWNSEKKSVSINPQAASSGKIGLAVGDILIKDTVTKLAPGIDVHEVVTNTETGDDQKIDYLCEIDLQGTETTKIVAGYGDDYSANSWKLVSTTKQAAAYEAKTGEKVVAAINADFFNMATGEPMGALVMDGQICHQANNRNYFAILKDGSAVIRQGNVPLDDCMYAVGGDAILVKDGEIADVSGSYGAEDYSRQAIGIRGDGTVVTFTTYGRLYPVSCGRTYKEIAEMMLDSGCEYVLALDGGGSATLATRPEGTDKLAVSNSPSDGAEREVSSTLLIVSTAKPTGVFDHASVTPNNEVYTPGSKVQFNANGSDSSGAAVDLPDDLTWALADDSVDLGEIDENGLFTAGSSQGIVNVELKQGDTVVGTTSIVIAIPDQIYFSSEEISLGFEETTDLGIVVRNQGRDIHYNAGDLVWTMTNEKLGTFDGNIFTSSDGESLNGNITAASKWDKDVASSIHVIVGMLPTVVWDFEDHEVTDEAGNVTNTIAAEDYYVNGYTTTDENGDEIQNPAVLNHSNYGRGGKESIEIVSIDDEEPIRFGSHALKLNYDFINCGAVTEGACVGTTESMEIPGTPTGIGVWVYAPEGTGIVYEGPGSQSGFWLRGYVRDGAGNNMPYDFTLEPKACIDENGNWNGVQPGIHWEGWMYCEADLTSMSAPFSIQPGMTFRLMYVAGTNMGTKTAGSVYFDNLQFVYGTNIDDVDNPVVDSITANSEELKDGDTLTTNTVTFDAYFHDVENKYMTGIDKDTVRMYIDGVNVVDSDNFEYALDPDGTRNHLYNVYLLNGQHSVTISLRDGFGNETTETRYFTVKGEEASTVPNVTVLPKEDAAYLGAVLNLEIRASDASKISQNTTSLTFGNQFTDYTVAFGENYEGSFEYKKLSGTLNISANRKADTLADDSLIAVVSFAVPRDLTDTAKFTYTVKSGSYQAGDKIYTYSAPEAALPVAASYRISADPVIVGAAGTIYVTDISDKPAEGLSVYYLGEQEELLGTTDTEGKLVTDRFSSAAGSYVIYAVDEEGQLSFHYTVGSYDAQGESGMPYGIMNNATVNPASEKKISWLSNPSVAGSQELSYRIEGTEEWTTVPANAQIRTFSKGGNSAVTVNNVMLTGLSAGTSYEYKVGSGDLWSEVLRFTTNEKSEQTSFFVLGDIQAEDLTNIDALTKMISEGDYDFGVQTGDSVDDPTSYQDWTDIISLIGIEKMGGTDLLHVLGNHEYAGDANADTSRAIYSLPASGAGSSYSVTYGNVYAAVINYTGSTANLRNALEWLEEDAAASDATWKILCIHQPAYYTNTSGGNADVHALVPAAAQRAGIDVVFSGHDHSYARTERLLDGEVNEDEGIVYYICGSSGEKSYTVTDNEDFHFAKLSSDYTGIYLSVSTTDETLKVDVYEVDGSLLDTYTMYRSACIREGKHQLTGEEAVYDPATQSMVCVRCGEELPLKDTGYTGFATDINGTDTYGDSQYYMLNGIVQTGFFTIGADWYYANDAGLIDHGLYMEDTSTCTTTGNNIANSPRYGETKIVSAVRYTGHEYEQQEDETLLCRKCGHTAIDIKDWKYALSYTAATYTGSAKMPAISITNPQTGEELVFHTDGTGLISDYRRTWANNRNVGTATVTIEATSYGDYVNSNGPVTLNLEIRPDVATGLTADATDTTADLSWTAPKAAKTTDITYVVYYSTDGTTWKKAGTTTDTTYQMSGLNQNTSYYFRLRSQALVDGRTYNSIGYSDVASVVTDEGISLANCSMSLNWTKTTYNGSTAGKRPTPTVVDPDGKKLVKGTDYTVTYEDNINAGTAKAIVTGKGRYGGRIEATFTIAPQNLKSAVLDIQDTVYSGGATQTVVGVTDENGLALTEGKDYTLTYSDNDSAGIASVKVTGIGNYTGTTSGTYQIMPGDISKLSARVENCVYTGKTLTSQVTVDGLTENTDYTVVYENNVNAGTAKAILIGMGNYSGTLEAAFEITPKDLSAAVITDNREYVYTGSEIEAEIEVVSDGVILVPDTDYEITGYENNVNTGTAVVAIRGIGNYAGTAEHEFEIRSADMTAFEVTLDPESYVFTGGYKKPGVEVKDTFGNILKKDVDYKVSYSDNRDAGAATVQVDGIGNYSGTVVRNFAIEPTDIAACEATLEYSSTVYSGGEKTPSVVVKTERGTTLKKGTNYTVTYRDNKNAGTATVEIAGIGNYGGTLTKTFEIKKADLSKCTVSFTEENTYYETGEAFTPGVSVKTAKGTKLRNGTNYKVSYSDNVKAGKATVLIEGIGNYEGTLKAGFTIKPVTDLSDFNATLSYSYMAYTGTARTPAVKVVTPKGTTLKKGTNYEVIYSDNVEIGTATVTINGIGKYCGTITKTFTIRPPKADSVKVSNVKRTSLKVEIGRNDLADKYYIYANGSYAGCAKTVSAVTVKNLKPDTDYNITVKAVKVVNGKNYYSAADSVKVRTAK